MQVTQVMLRSPFGGPDDPRRTAARASRGQREGCGWGGPACKAAEARLLSTEEGPHDGTYPWVLGHRVVGRAGSWWLLGRCMEQSRHAERVVPVSCEGVM